MPAPARRSVFADRLLEFPNLVFSDGREFQHRGRWQAWFSQRAVIGGSDTPVRHAAPPRPSQNHRAAPDVGQAAHQLECPTHQIAHPIPRPLILDIGCNDAALLASVAAKHPTTNFIGIDWKPRVLHTAAERVAAASLRNVALLHARAQDLRRLFADGELDEIWLFHPEPLDTPREMKNRLISETFLIDVHHVLRPRGVFILKTDHRGYFDAAIELLQSMPARFEITSQSSDFWTDPKAQSAIADRAFAGEMTAFEGRFVRKRKPIFFVTVQSRNSPA